MELLSAVCCRAGKQDQSTTRQKRKKKRVGNGIPFGGFGNGIRASSSLIGEKKGLSVEPKLHMHLVLPRFAAGCPVGHVSVHSRIISKRITPTRDR